MSSVSSTSGSSSSTSSNGNRITGLSGLDTDSMVKQMMAADQAKIDKAKQSEQYTEWQQTAYQSVIKELKEFYTKYIDTSDLTSSTGFFNMSNYNGVGATLADDDKTSLGVTTQPGAAKGTYSVTIKQLASGANVTGNTIGNITSNALSNDDALALAGKTFSFIDKDGHDVSVTLGNQATLSADIGSTGSGTKAIAKELNDKLSSSGISVNGDNGNLVFNMTGNASAVSSPIALSRSNSKLTDLGVDFGNSASEALSVAVGSKNFTVTIGKNDTINDLINKFKTTTDADGNSLANYATIGYSELTGKLSIETKDTGTAATLKISDGNITKTDGTTGAGNLASKLGLAVDTTGQNAIVEIQEPNAASAVQVVQSSNKFTVDNVTYNLQTTTKNPDGTYSAIKVAVSANASDSVKKIQSFVDDYNTLIGNINTLLTEKKDRNYQPLTDDQKKDMTDDQVTKWETKAKQGILSNDTVLSGLLSSLRTAVYQKVNGAGISNLDIGITTTSDYKNAGKLQVDTAKLQDALENRADQVYKLFSSRDKNSPGIAKSFADAFNAAVGPTGTLVQKAGYTDTRWEVNNELSISIADQKSKLNTMKENFQEKQTRYYTMYATLESNLSSLSSQSSWLNSAFSNQ